MSSEITRLLTAVAGREPGAADALYQRLYGELRTLAAQMMKRERPDHTLQTTALVNEAYLKLVQSEGAALDSRAHFLALAARAMRCILCDHARRRRRRKRGGGRGRTPLDESIVAAHEAGGVDLVALDDGLSNLREINARAASIVEMRFFGGLAMDEIAVALDVSVTTVEREWRYARAWLVQALGDSSATRTR
jgi:RNA polymerase sigma factor (TIGR02999 family)